MTDFDFPELVPRDRLDQHHRQQLSAMLDGELPPDQAKFMLRRLQHDGQLAACWERWQVSGDILRGRHDVLLPVDFSQRVAQAIAEGDAPQADVLPVVSEVSKRHGVRWLRWGGGALAASVALLALFMARPITAPLVDESSARVAVSQPPVTATDLSAVDAATGASVVMPGTLGQVPQAAAVNGVSAIATMQGSRGRDTRSTRSQTQRAGLWLRARAADQAPQTALAAAAPMLRMTAAEMRAVAIGTTTHVAGIASADQFATQPVAPARPWPRAILPGYAAGGAFTASYGNEATATFHPFEPQVETQTYSAAGINVDAPDEANASPAQSPLPASQTTGARGPR